MEYNPTYSSGQTHGAATSHIPPTSFGGSDDDQDHPPPPLTSPVLYAFDIAHNQSVVVTSCKGNLTDLRRILHLSLAKGNPK
jgi:hypothetical protein